VGHTVLIRTPVGKALVRWLGIEYADMADIDDSEEVVGRNLLRIESSYNLIIRVLLFLLCNVLRMLLSGEFVNTCVTLFLNWRLLI